MRSSIAIAALVVAGIGLNAAVPAIAQTAPAAGNQIGLSLNDNPTPLPPDGDQVGLSLDDGAASPQLLDARAMMPGRGPAGGALGPLMLACSDKGAEALDLALVRVSYRLDLTAEQKPLFDAFREKALTTETAFADQCKTDLPKRDASAKPDLLDGIKARLGIEQARLTALNEVLPSFEALYNSLTDQQKAALVPHHQGGKWDMRQDGGRMMRPEAPGRG